MSDELDFEDQDERALWEKALFVFLDKQDPHPYGQADDLIRARRHRSSKVTPQPVNVAALRAQQFEQAREMGWADAANLLRHLGLDDAAEKLETLQDHRAANGNRAADQWRRLRPSRQAPAAASTPQPDKPASEND